MQKFVLKFLLIFVVSITTLFFSLIAFQGHQMQKEMMEFQNQNVASMADFGQMPPMGPPPEKEPPAIIPCLFIIFVSTLFVYFLLRYINRNFVAPLVIIEENLKEIKKGNLKVKFKTISENKAVIDTYKTLNEMVEGLIQKEKLQDNFIQCLTHDLRTPMIAQERALAILQEEYQDNELLSGMLQNTEGYLKMINLVMEATSEKQIKIDKTEFNLSNMTQAVVRALRPMAEEKGVILNSEIPEDFIIWADYISFNRIITNLTSNAVENVPYNRTVTIKAENIGEKTVVIVEDTGDGIDRETIKTLFNKYASKNKSGKKSVSGLGLYIVSELVKKHNGSIRVESEINKYTRFIIEIPKEKEDESA